MVRLWRWFRFSRDRYAPWDGGRLLKRGPLPENLERLFRDARASLIEDGTNDVLSLAAAQKVLDSYQP
jgi:alkylation response protein AidB-like acyl-CoA dehydrogenase